MYAQHIHVKEKSFSLMSIELCCINMQQKKSNKMKNDTEIQLD